MKKIIIILLVLLLAVCSFGLTMEINTRIEASQRSLTLTFVNEHNLTSAGTNGTHINLNDYNYTISSNNFKTYLNLINLTNHNYSISANESYESNLTIEIDREFNVWYNDSLKYDNSSDDFLLNLTTSNVSLDLKEILNTGIYSNDFDFTNIIINSPTWTTASNNTLSTNALNEKISVGTSFNVVKITGVGTNDVWGRMLVDGVPILTEKLRSVSKIGSILNEGATMFKPLVQSLSIGEHDLVIQFYITGSGSVEINDFDLTLVKLNTEYADVFLLNEEFNATFSNTNFETIIALPVNFSLDSSLFNVAKISFNASSPTQIVCRLVNNKTGLISEHLGNYISSSTDLKVGGFIRPSIVSERNFVYNLECLSTLGVPATIDVSYVSMSLTDLNGNKISHSYGFNEATNYTNTLVLGSGITKIASMNLTNEVNGQAIITANVFMGENSGKLTPSFFINSSTADINCFSKKERSVDAGDSGMFFMIHNCDNITAGTTNEYNLYSNISTGESILLYDEMLGGFETLFFNTTLNNVPPSIAITYPINNSILDNSLMNITWVYEDLNKAKINLTLIGATNYSILINGDASDEIKEFDPSTIVDGNYILQAIVEENETTELFKGYRNISFSFDFTDPSGTFVSPSSSGTEEGNTIKVNASLTDNIGLNNVTINLFNSESILLDSVNYALNNATSITQYHQFINLGYGLYKYNAVVTDNINRSFTIDNTSVLVVFSDGSSGGGSSSNPPSPVIDNNLEIGNATINVSLNATIDVADDSFLNLTRVKVFLTNSPTEKFKILKNYYIIILMAVLTFLFIYFELKDNNVFLNILLWFISTMVLSGISIFIIYLIGGFFL